MRASRVRAALCLSLVASFGANGGCGRATLETTAAAPFDHDTFFLVGGSHARFSCVDCHDATASSFAEAAVDCLECHGEAAVSPLHQGVSGYAWVNGACIGCHKTGTMSVAHAQFFPIAAGDRHAGIACADCHGAVRAVADLRCTSCHGGQSAMDGAHGNLAGYSWSSAACYECHRDGSIPGFAHAFPIASGATHGPPTACADCHGVTRLAADLTCTGCHDHAQPATDPVHVGVTGYTYASPACFDCHPTGGTSLPQNHDADLFPVTGSPSHGGLACSQCHGATRALADLTCIPCHTQQESALQHARIPATTTGERDRVAHPNYRWDSAYCVRCHADGQVHLIAEHPRFDGGLTREGHAPFCLTCHTAAKSSGKTWAADFDQWTCLACHANNNPD